MVVVESDFNEVVIDDYFDIFVEVYVDVDYGIIVVVVVDFDTTI